MKRLLAIVGLLAMLIAPIQAEEKSSVVYVAGMTGVT